MRVSFANKWKDYLTRLTKNQGNNVVARAVFA